jgi:indolepyruvate ferredoxin oxidoreductase beta subunit
MGNEPTGARQSVLIVGVGGQGTLLASRLIGRLATNAGHDVKVSEVHGMSQRGGSVVTYVKFGPAVYSPLIEEGEAGLLVAFEMLEAARWLGHLAPGGLVVANVQQVAPMPVITGQAEYPQGLEDRVRAACPDARLVDALPLARACGDQRALNVVLLGVAARAGALGFSKDEWLAAVRAVAPARALDVNLAAFERGYGL